MKLIFYTLKHSLDPEEIKKTSKFLPIIVTDIARREFGDFDSIEVSTRRPEFGSDALLACWSQEEIEKAEEGGYLTIQKTKNFDFCCCEPDGCLDDHIIVLTKTEGDPIFGEYRYAYGLIATEDDMPKIVKLATSSDKPADDDMVEPVTSSDEAEEKDIPSESEIDRIIGDGARYTINDDGTIDVEWAAFGELRIEKKHCKDGRLPLRFGDVDVDFDCSNCGLTTLEGAPKYVRSTFRCNDNNLTSLTGGPEVVKGSYKCQNNQLTSLEGAPKRVGHISEDTYTSFDTGESWTTGYSSYCDFDCQNNNITTLEGVDMCVMGTLRCSGNRIAKKKKFNVVVKAGTVRWGKQNQE